MKASIHARFYEQVKHVPRLEVIMQRHGISTDHPGTEMRSSPYLLWQVDLLAMRSRGKFAILEHESTLNSRSRQARLTGGMNEGGGGGRRASAMAARMH
eukprot:3178948-Pyramimonas_sp.AAC.1